MIEPRTPVGVFVSHTHADKGIALALDRALVRLFGSGDAVSVSYSSKKHEAGAPRGGENWFGWIVDQVRDTRVALVLLTPASINKPWVLWEAGAVQGVALGAEPQSGNRVIPLTYGLRATEVPTPFQQVLVSAGDSRDDMEKVFDELIREYVPVRRQHDAGKVQAQVLDEYLAAVEVVLRDAPLLPTEAVVQEWCARLDDLRASSRESEVGHLHDWLRVAFGRERGEQERPLDFRIHRRLGELYASAPNWERAATQFDLARSLAPRDLLVLRQLGRAYLEDNRLDAAGDVIAQIETLDPAAFVHNVECAALKGRWHRQRGELVAERDVYRNALGASPQSYYLADLLGQVELQLGEVGAAGEAYARASRILDALGDRNVWTHATMASAELLAGREPEGLAELRLINEYEPDADQLSSIERGLERLRDGLDVDATTFARWVAALGTRRKVR
jgi:tetratricopeptide (TPR) repeat protein